MNVFVGQTAASDQRSVTHHQPALFRTCEHADRAADEQIAMLERQVEYLTDMLNGQTP